MDCVFKIVEDINDLDPRDMDNTLGLLSLIQNIAGKEQKWFPLTSFTMKGNKELGQKRISFALMMGEIRACLNAEGFAQIERKM
jgi:hypothetical protein